MDTSPEIRIGPMESSPGWSHPNWSICTSQQDFKNSRSKTLFCVQSDQKLCSRMNAGFSLGLNDRAQRPVVLFSALSFFLSALSFFQRPVIFREPFGFFGLSSALF